MAASYHVFNVVFICRDPSQTSLSQALNSRWVADDDFQEWLPDTPDKARIYALLGKLAASYYTDIANEADPERPFGVDPLSDGRVVEVVDEMRITGQCLPNKRTLKVIRKKDGVEVTSIDYDVAIEVEARPDSAPSQVTQANSAGGSHQGSDGRTIPLTGFEGQTTAESTGETLVLTTFTPAGPSISAKRSTVNGSSAASKR